MEEQERLEPVVALVALAITALAAWKTIRDGSGNLVETWTRKGDRIEVRDKDNNLSLQTNREGSRVIIHDGSNNKVGEIRGQDD